jgi:hypothetical protein
MLHGIGRRGEIFATARDECTQFRDGEFYAGGMDPENDAIVPRAAVEVAFEVKKGASLLCYASKR